MDRFFHKFFFLLQEKNKNNLKCELSARSVLAYKIIIIIFISLDLIVLFQLRNNIFLARECSMLKKGEWEENVQFSFLVKMNMILCCNNIKNFWFLFFNFSLFPFRFVIAINYFAINIVIMYILVINKQINT
jgi:hypothetical protein